MKIIKVVNVFGLEEAKGDIVTMYESLQEFIDAGGNELLLEKYSGPTYLKTIRELGSDPYTVGFVVVNIDEVIYVEIINLLTDHIEILESIDTVKESDISSDEEDCISPEELKEKLVDSFVEVTRLAAKLSGKVSEVEALKSLTSIALLDQSVPPEAVDLLKVDIEELIKEGEQLQVIVKLSAEAVEEIQEAIEELNN